MFRIERKIFHVGTEKIVMPYYCKTKFTLNQKVLALLSLMRKIMQLQENDKKCLC
jgi:hypothetical protein